ncbi:hypothetical protein AURDEDRAFT_188828 [Auricularia subglabra TFB-10046 SS5]|uniref:MYND-type domain-containing protein n=1 Tax=Auricularia subglabra (strain TFB-10046 / SS5) TaxID=717982 RepID=J0CWS9_AURST|nr:hypothetical protein AURDEDRAFT_188828 [Auricularia subglabra TFB-10046 SS5]
MELLSRADALAAFLPGDFSQPACPRCFASFADLLWSSDPSDIDRLLAVAHPFLNACVAIILKLSGNDIDNLRAALETSDATCIRAHAAPRTCLTEGRDAVHVIVDAACHSLGACFIRPTEGASDRANKARAAFESRGGHWPTSATQLFPDGEAIILRALVHWAGVLESGSPLHVIAGFTALAHPIVFSTIVRDRELHAALVAVILERLRTCELVSRAEFYGAVENRSPAFRACIQSILAVSMLLAVIQNGPDGGENDTLILLQPRAQEAFRTIVRALDFLEGTTGTGAYPLLAEVANRLQQLLKLPDSALPPAVRAHRLPDMNIIDMVIWVLALLREKRSRWCPGPGCGRFVHQLEPGAAMHPCAGCGIAHYCSRACERRDWEDGRHEKLCSIMSAIEQADVAFDAFQVYSREDRNLIVNFAVSHDVLSWELKERARHLLAPRVEITAFVIGGFFRGTRAD